MWHLLQSNPTEFLAQYYKREHVESTFAAIKKKLGETLSSRDPNAQVNELLCKVLVHNIQILIQASFERGIPLPAHGSPDDEPVAPQGLPPVQATRVSQMNRDATHSANWPSENN
ncbi:MAG: hypothetical protein L3K04_01005 [Thermoplasmata archaeon]|nr:hypothetical protein [Thermoplasmata archaeon]MCI4340805.1 hypothetical protein [Thermoplasmata archaeon]